MLSPMNFKGTMDKGYTPNDGESSYDPLSQARASFSVEL
jgi:hypothetical protein